jgi:thiol:disulfide interchange protein DsbC
MLKQSLIALSLFAAFTSAHATADFDKMRKQLTDRMPGTQIGAITKAPYAGLYEVVANGFNVFYTDEQADIAIIGKMINLKTGKDLVQARTQELMHVDFASLPLDKAIVKVKGDGSRKLAVFSDPDCPFCHELEQELAKVNDVTIYIFLYPLTELHPDSERKANLVWCAANPAKAWDELMQHGKEPAAAKPGCEAPLKEINAFAQKSWITGTPGLIFADGQLVAGSVTSAQIETYLEDKAKAAASAKMKSAAAESAKKQQ